MCPCRSAQDRAAAHLARLDFSNQVVGLLKDVDLLVIPTLTSTVPTANASEDAALVAGQLAAAIRFTAPFDVSGSPTITLPNGFDANGLPLSFQLVGPHLWEHILCRAGAAYQPVTEWHLRHPKCLEHLEHRAKARVSVLR
jgi:amidase